MSIDERLREGFGPQDRAWDAQAPVTLSRVKARRRRDLAVRRGAALILVAAAAVAAVALAAQPDRQTAVDPVRPAAPTAEAMGVLEGRWRSAPVETADIRADLREAGLADYSDEALALLPPRPFRIVFTVTGSDLALDLVAGRAREQWDLETIQINDGRLVLNPVGARGQSEHRWVLTEGELRLSFVGTTEIAVDRVPAEVWQRILYDSASFRR